MLFRDTYGKQREKLSKECESLVNKAENHFQSNGRYTEAEQKLYEQAEQLCQQLMDLHDTGSAEYSSWQRSKNMYSAKVAEIERTLKGISAQSAVKSAGSSAKPAQPAANQAVPPVKPAQPAANEASVQQESVTAENRSKTETRTLTTTPSGFSTYNARDKLSASAIEQWFPKGKDIPTHGLDDLSGMDEVKAVFKKLIEATDWEKTYKALQYQNKFGFVLFGPPGSGKTHFIEAFVHEMINKGYTYMKLLGGDIRNSYVGETEKNIEALFNEAIDKSPCVIFIDEFEGVCRERTSGESKSYDQSATIAFLEGYNRLHSHMKNNGAPVLFFCATNHLNQLDEAMQSRLSKIYVPLPDEKARRVGQSVAAASLPKIG